MSKARVVTVHLVIADSEDKSDYEQEAEIADGLSALLGDAEASGFLLDWGYANNATPEKATVIDAADYDEGDFYTRAGLPFAIVVAGGGICEKIDGDDPTI
jgi:hypothetical protein